jgi:hypothetical protein
MNATLEVWKEPAESDLYREIGSLIRKNPRRWQTVCAVACLGGSLVAPFLGVMLDVVARFINSVAVNSYLHAVSMILCGLTVPLLILGAACLDLLEAKNRQTDNRLPPLVKSFRPHLRLRAAIKRPLSRRPESSIQTRRAR